MYSQKKKRIGSTKPKEMNKNVKSGQEPTRKHDYLNNFGLKKIFSKVDVNRNGTNDHNIYEIKDKKTISTNLKAKVTPEKNNVNEISSCSHIPGAKGTQEKNIVDEISSCSHIPGLTDEDLKEIIKISEIEELLEKTVDEFNASPSPNIDFPTLSTPHVIDSSQSINTTCDSTLTHDFGFPTLPIENIFHQYDENPLDLSIIKVDTPKSTLMPSNSSSIPLRSSLIPLNPARKPNDQTRYVMRHNYKIPKAHSKRFTQHIPKSHFPDKKCSSSPSSTTTSYPTQTINNIMGTAKAACQENRRKQVPRLVMMPSMILEEILGLKGIKPTYELLPIGCGFYSTPIYRYRVSFNDQQDYGSGKSMQDAKNSAARALLDKLTSNNFFGNVIGSLQELCVARRWPLPIYEPEHVPDLLTNKGRDFIISCTVLEHKVFGQGRNKKIAKLLAAYKMWMKINLRT